MKQFIRIVAAMAIVAFSGSANAQWAGYPIWPPMGSPFYNVAGFSGYYNTPNYYPYSYSYSYPYYVRPPVIVAPTLPVAPVPQYTVPSIPQNPAPTGYQWNTILDAACNCIRWVVVPVR